MPTYMDAKEHAQSRRIEVRAQPDGLKSRRVANCTECHMDFFLDIFDFGERDAAMVVTMGQFWKWFDAFFRDWKCHFPQTPQYTSEHQAAATGAIKERFEAQPGQSFKEWSRVNLARLFSGLRLKFGQRSMQVEGSPGLV